MFCQSVLPGSVFWMCHQSMVTGSPRRRGVGGSAGAPESQRQPEAGGGQQADAASLGMGVGHQIPLWVLLLVLV